MLNQQKKKRMKPISLFGRLVSLENLIGKAPGVLDDRYNLILHIIFLRDGISNVQLWHMNYWEARLIFMLVVLIFVFLIMTILLH